jgi:murein DD-endopeptidase MepM/ murein hydrolase activator NlpD
MIDSSEIDEEPAVCEECRGLFYGGGYVQADGRSVTIFCSEDCFADAARAQKDRRWAARRRATRRLTVSLVLLAGFLTPHPGPWPAHKDPIAPSVPHVTLADSELSPLPPGWYGPLWPPTEMSVLAALGRDAWVHPMAGPIRRMPRADSRVFGAVRPGERAVECRNGHCGVDLGGEIWGEHIRAVHDGVVDFVQRGPNPDHGGRFVRISHRLGTVFTWYFHLAAIPREIERGVSVRAGDLLGLLGDSGVHQSAPHLHFAISVRPSKAFGERYIDPEPLIALWPLRIPLDGSEVGLVTTTGEPGFPLGSALLRPGRQRKLLVGKGGRQIQQNRQGQQSQQGQKEEQGNGRAASVAGSDEGPLTDGDSGDSTGDAPAEPGPSSETVPADMDTGE